MYHKIETKYGNVWAIATQKDHIYVGFGSNLNVDHEGPESRDRQGPLTVRGVEYAGSIHAYLWSDGKWHVGPEKEPSLRYQSLYLSRARCFDYRKSQAISDSARKAVEAEVMPQVQKWADEHPELIRNAERQHLTDGRAKCVEEIHKRQLEISTLQQEVARYDTELAAL